MTTYETVIDGIIDKSVQQGQTGDCWLLSAILALNSSKNGKKIIKNSIEVQENNDVVVRFNGLKYDNGEIVSYTIPENEIFANLHSSKYSKGDIDLLVFELAVNRLEHDIYMQSLIPAEETEEETETPEAAEPKIVIPKNIATYKTNPETNGMSYIEGGYSERLLFFLTGIVPEVKEADFQKVIKSDGECFSGLSFPEVANILNKYAREDFAITFSLYPDLDNLIREKRGWCSIHKRIDLNRKLFTLHLPIGNIKFEDDVPMIDISSANKFGGHCLYITQIDIEKRTVTIANPQNSEEEFTFSWNGFVNMGVFSITSIAIKESED